MKNFLASFVNTDGVAFPETAAVNSSGGGATDGTEFVKLFVDDLWGWMQELLNYTDDSPNGNSEVGASQLLESLIKIVSNHTELTSNATHTVEEFDKFSNLILSSGCTIARLEGGTGADETNKLLVQNNNTVTVEVDFGAAVNQEEIIMQPGQWIEFVYDSEASKFVFQRSDRQIIVNTAINYTVGDWLPSGSKIMVTCNTAAQYGLITITLPTLADNIGKNYEVEHGSAQGLVAVVPETPASEKLNFRGSQIQSSYIYSSGMGYKYYNNGVDWTMKGTNAIVRGRSARSDWTNTHNGGNGVTYDNGSAGSTKNTDWTGQVITEATSGFSALVVEDTGGTGVSGILYTYELSSSFTFWTNNRVLTSSSGQTIDINEVGGTSKNVDYNFYHGFSLDLINVSEVKFFWSSDGTKNNYWELNYYNDTANRGFQLQGVDNNQLIFQTGSTGATYLDAAGSSQPLSTNDDFDDVIVDFSC